MPFSAALVLGGANIVGGVMAGNAAKSAANTSAQAQLQAAQIKRLSLRINRLNVG